MNDWGEQPRDFSCGRYLQGARLAQRIRLDDLSRATCIGIDNLIHLESDDLAHLPAQVFVVGYIRTYARTVGADPEEALRRYHAYRRRSEAQAQWEIRRARASRRFWARLGLAVCVLVGLVAATVYLMAPVAAPPSPPVSAARKSDTPSAPPSSSIEPVGAAPAGTPPDGETVPAQPLPSPAETVNLPSQSSAAQRRHRYQLDIWAVKDLWLKVLVDDQHAQVYKLKKGDTLHLEALTGINLLIEDSSGVELTLDGAALPIPGKAGQVVNLEIP